MRASRRLDLVWLLLVGLTLGGAFLGEAAESGFWVTVLIAAIMAFKGRLVIDHFMELADANRTIRRMVRLYGIAIPLLLVLTYVFGSQIASLTGL
jgi:hypothetical protein